MTFCHLVDKVLLCEAEKSSPGGAFEPVLAAFVEDKRSFEFFGRYSCFG